MENKTIVIGVTGIVGSAIANLFGGWSSDLATLLIFMGIDFITGLIVAGVSKTSNKSENGTLSSKVGFVGLAKKVITLFFVLIGYRLDLLMGIDYIKTAVVIAFIVNETISIIENAGLMGIPIPKPIMNAIDVLKEDNAHEGNRRI